MPARLLETNVLVLQVAGSSIPDRSWSSDTSKSLACTHFCVAETGSLQQTSGFIEDMNTIREEPLGHLCELALDTSKLRRVQEEFAHRSNVHQQPNFTSFVLPGSREL